MKHSVIASSEDLGRLQFLEDDKHFPSTSFLGLQMDIHYPNTRNIQFQIKWVWKFQNIEKSRIDGGKLS